MADYTDTIRSEAAAAGLTPEQTDAIIAQVGRAVIGGYAISNRASENAARAAIAAARPRAATAPGATPRQVEYLLALGATIAQVDGISRADASALIDTLKSGCRPAYVETAAAARTAGRRHGVPGEVWD